MAERDSLWFERQAMDGAEMPDGLTLAEQAAYQALRDLHRAFRQHQATRDAAAREKAKIRRALEDAQRREAFWSGLAKDWADRNRLTETAKAEYLKNPCQENAVRLIAVLDGMERGST